MSTLGDVLGLGLDAMDRTLSQALARVQRVMWARLERNGRISVETR
jgi:uncharacterized membrane protein YcaP (DUF421 family)